MVLNSKLTGGLAWLGLAVILAVPVANFFTSGDGATSTVAANAAVVDAKPTAATPKAVAEVKPKKDVAPVTRSLSGTPAGDSASTTTSKGDAVDTFLQKGKKLPSYISDAPEGTQEVAAVTPKAEVAPVKKVAVPGMTLEATTLPAVKADGTTGTQPATVASLPKTESVAPIPAPAWMRPKTQVATTVPVVSAVPATTGSVTTPNRPAITNENVPLIVDENLVARREAAVDRVLGDQATPVANDTIVSGDQLEEWDSGSLADYLERRGMMSGQAANDDETFFEDERPRSRVIRRVRPREDDFNFF